MASKSPRLQVVATRTPIGENAEGGMRTEYNLRLVGKNGEVVMQATQGYTRLGDAMRAAHAAKRLMAEAEIVGV